MTDTIGPIAVSAFMVLSSVIASPQNHDGSCEVNFTYGGPESGMTYFCQFRDHTSIGGEEAHRFMADLGIEVRAGLRVQITNGHIVVTDIFRGGRK